VIPAAPAAVPQAVELALLAVLQGLTEFLPVSSSGHLVLAQAALGFEGSAVRLDVALHLGTLGAVLVAYRRDLVALAREALRGELRAVGVLALATVPAVVVGLGFHAALHAAFSSVRVAAAGLCGTAAILAVGEAARRRTRRAGAEGGAEGGGRERVGVVDALWIGAAQAVAILPGVSRSGATIAAGLVRGLHPRGGARFSFLLAFRTSGGGALLVWRDVVGGGEAAFGIGGGALLAAVLLAGAVGLGALRALLAFLGRGVFGWFAGYCAVVGGVVLVVA
jgi:undecaprenyl-diphosphatase